MENQTIKAEYQQALIYCRVSSDRQVNEGHGLDSQAQRCLKRAEQLGFSDEKIKVFRDEGVSGGLFERPAMQALIAYMDKSKGQKFVVIFDDLKRFARDVSVHLQLKAELVAKRKAKLECLNFNIEDKLETGT